MSNINVITVDSKKLLNLFLKIPYKIYKDDNNWVPPLNMDIKHRLSEKENPFFEYASQQLFIAYLDNEPVGRIAAIENRKHNEIHNDKVGFFGYFEAIDNQNVANALFAKAEEWLKAKGLDIVRGPASPSSNDEYALLVDGFDDSPRIMMPYNPKYYIDLIENYGFKKAHDLYAYKLENEKVLSTEKLIRGVDLVKKRTGVNIRTFNLKKMNEELELVKKIYNKAWQPNWGFVPFSDKEMDDIAKSLKPLLDPNLILFAEINNEPIGFALVMPDYNEVFKKMNGKLFPFGIFKLLFGKKKIKWARILILGVLPEHQKKGLDSVMYYQITKNAQARGILLGEGSWILDDNEMINKGMLQIGGTLYKTYRVYEKTT